MFVNWNVCVPWVFEDPSRRLSGCVEVGVECPESEHGGVVCGRDDGGTARAVVATAQAVPRRNVTATVQSERRKERQCASAVLDRSFQEEARALLPFVFDHGFERINPFPRLDGILV